ncbi:hypothetical protein Ancab_005579 [Ancistrocladus abbreviatus]
MTVLSLSSSLQPFPVHHNENGSCGSKNKNKNTDKSTENNENISNWQRKTLTRFLTGALSLSLLVSSPSSIALDSISNRTQLSPPTSAEYCREDEQEEREAEIAPKLVTNEGIVEEAWGIVNDSFLNTSRRGWSPKIWLRKKEDILSHSIQTRPKAHDIIRRMLASLGDRYTRYLYPEEFSKMARYDMTGIGINLREVLDKSGSLKLKVLGLILDGPAHSAGVRQVSITLYAAVLLWFNGLV